METAEPSALVWLRRDLRTHDQAALYHALKSHRQVHCAFVFDTDILDPLPRRDRRVEFIRESLVELDESLRGLARQPQAGLIVLHGRACEEITRLASQLGVSSVLANHDYEPGAQARDGAVRDALETVGVAFHTFKDQAIFDHRELLTLSGRPYSVFTPYKRAWLSKLKPFYLQAYPVERYAASLAPRPLVHQRPVPALAELGFAPAGMRELGIAPGATAARAGLQDFLGRIERYAQARDYPAANGPSYLSVHLRFGTLSVREAAAAAHARAATGSAGAQAWLGELIWRDFFFQVLANYPHVVDADGSGHSFRPEYDAIAWEDGALAHERFAAWCEGRTGYPLVDAAMAQINQTGYMHNRLRMVVASFLTKDLGIDWRWGERWFAEKLNDFDLSANNGGWQWAAGTGCDAQPWFRIFNPVSQSRKFDPQGRFILHYLPQLARLPLQTLHEPWTARPVDLQAAGIRLGSDYPVPLVRHEQAREETLQRYAAVKTAPR